MNTKTLGYWTMLTCQQSYYVGNMNKKECRAWLVERGMSEDEAKAEVKNW